MSDNKPNALEHVWKALTNQSPSTKSSPAQASRTNAPSDNNNTPRIVNHHAFSVTEMSKWAGVHYQGDSWWTRGKPVVDRPADGFVDPALAASQSLDMPDYGIAVLLPPYFYKRGLELKSAEEAQAERGGWAPVVSYGPHEGINPVWLCDTAFVVEVKDGERFMRIIDIIGLGSMEVVLRQIYDDLYGPEYKYQFPVDGGANS